MAKHQAGAEDESVREGKKRRRLNEPSGVEEKALVDDNAEVSGSDNEDEDEEQEDDGGAFEMNGFIVNEKEISEGEEEIEDEDMVDEGLDEDDLNLIKETYGEAEGTSNNSFRRLKQNRALFGADADSGGLFDDENESQGEVSNDDWMPEADTEGPISSQQQRRMLAAIFGDVRTVMDIIEGKKPKFDVYEETDEKAVDEGDIDMDQTSLAKPLETIEQSSKISSSDASSGLNPPTEAAIENPSSQLPSALSQPERLSKRYRYRAFPVDMSIVAAEAVWMMHRLKEESNVCPLPFSLAVAKSDLLPPPEETPVEDGWATETTTSVPKENDSSELKTDEKSEPIHIYDLLSSPVSEVDEFLRPIHLSQLFNSEIQAQRYQAVFRDTAPECAEYNKSYYPSIATLEAEITEKIEIVLHLLLNERYEVPVMLRQRGHHICPPLTPEIVYLIYEWDVIWWRINDAKMSLRKDLTLRDPHENVVSFIESLIRNANTMEAVNDIANFIEKLPFHYPSPSKPLTAPAGARKSSIKKRRAATTAVFNLFQQVLQTGCHHQWEKCIMNVRSLVANSSKLPLGVYKAAYDCRPSGSNTERCPFDGLEGIAQDLVAAPEPPHWDTFSDPASELNRWATSVTEGCHCEGKNPEALIVRYEGQKLSSYPQFRQLVRKWFMGIATVTTVTTSAGEMAVDATKRNWAALRLIDKPIQQLWERSPYEINPFLIDSTRKIDTRKHPLQRWSQELKFIKETNSHREIGVEIHKAEKDRMIDVIIGPISVFDSLPWKKDERNRISDSGRWAKGIPKSNSLNKTEDAEYVKEFGSLQAMERKHINHINLFLEYLTFCMSSTKHSPSWVSFLKNIVTEAVLRNLLPVLRKEVKEFLYSRSCDYIAYLCKVDLARRLGTQPPTNVDFPQIKGWIDFQALEEDANGDTGEGTLPADALTELEAANLVSSGEKVIEEPDAVEQALVERGSPDDELPVRDTPEVLSLVFDVMDNSIHAVRCSRLGHINSHRVYSCLPNYLSLTAREANMDDAMKADLRQSQEYQRAHKDARDFEFSLLVKSTRPNLVVLGLDSNRTFYDLYTYVQRIRDTRLRHKLYKFQVVVAFPDVSRIAAQSDLWSVDEKDNYGTTALIAASLGRYVQNPMAELLSLWNPTFVRTVGNAAPPGGTGADDEKMILDEESEQTSRPCLLSLHLHPLQSEIPTALLESAALSVITRAVNDCGVAVNPALNVSHLIAPLQFVAGLGPQSVRSLKHALPSPSGIGNSLLMSRKSLLELENPFSRIVYFNCAAFLRIPADEFMFELAQNNGLDPLDDSRIHPSESANIAVKMCKDAQDDQDDAVAEVLKNPDHLEELDLEAYASILYAKGQLRMYPFLEFLKSELEHPFKDPRCPFEVPITHEALFYGLTSPDLQRCSEVTLRVKSVRNREFLLLPFEVPASVNDFDAFLSQKRKDMTTLDPGLAERVNLADDECVVGQNSIIKGRIDKIHFESYKVECLATEAELKALLEQNLTPITMYDVDHLSPLIDGDITAASRMKHRTLGMSQVSKPRVTLNHPLFINQSSAKIINNMKRNGKVGQVYFGPPENNETGVYIYIQTCSNPFRYKIFLIRDNAPNLSTGELSKELSLGSQKFMSLEHVLETYTGPFIACLEEMYNHEKYDPLSTQSDLIEKLKAAAERSTVNSLQWGIILDRDSPQTNERAVRFFLVCVSLKRPGKYGNEPKSNRDWLMYIDSLYVKPEGFSLWTHNDRSLTRLINWWKTEGFMNRPKNIIEYAAFKKQKLSAQHSR